ncbi:AI-2E family transporter [Halorubrum sp. CSM-61]|uniref:AI-2E family transporter n=1 Tax=Halorubrum sp. CSM-61 TaxID=2485838 RepID=UPI000F4C923E|nr:AI-2E family transporter [Halorubrum sp. CSM-61]
MSQRSGPPTWLAGQPGLTALALLSSLLVLLVLLPYLQFALFGVVLAYILYPVQVRAEEYVRPTVAALGVVVAALVFVLIPIIYLLTIAVRQSLRVVSAVRDGQFDLASIEGLLADIGFRVDIATLYESNQERIATSLQQVTSGAIDLVGSLPGLFIGLTITLFVLFALLRDGERFAAWVQWVLPIDDDVLGELREGLDQLMWASVVGNVAVAAIQAVLLGVGLAIAGLPAVIFLTVATFVLTLLPLVGSFGIWIPAAVYLVAVGRPVAAAAIAVYGLIVTFSDTYLRPALIGRTGAFNSTTIVIGIFGGLAVFGAVGLFIGPVVLGGAKLVLDCFARAHAGESTA